MAVTLEQVRKTPFIVERSLHKTPARCSNPKSGGVE